MNLNNWEYLILLLLCSVIPFLYSIIHRKLLSQYHLHVFQPTILIAAIPFVIFDIVAVLRGYWYFNFKYITGFHILNLPIEEYIFFLVIPQSSLLIWIALKRYTSFKIIKEDIMQHFEKKTI